VARLSLWHTESDTFEHGHVSPAGTPDHIEQSSNWDRSHRTLQSPSPRWVAEKASEEVDGPMKVAPWSSSWRHAAVGDCVRQRLSRNG